MTNNHFCISKLCHKILCCYFHVCRCGYYSVHHFYGLWKWCYRMLNLNISRDSLQMQIIHLFLPTSRWYKHRWSQDHRTLRYLIRKGPNFRTSTGISVWNCALRKYITIETKQLLGIKLATTKMWEMLYWGDFLPGSMGKHQQMVTGGILQIKCQC